MRWGDPESFAIEAEETGSQGKWRFGRLQIFAGGQAYGDLDDAVDLGSAARWGRVFLGASGRRTRADFEGLGAEEAYRALYGRHFEPGAPAVPIERDPYLLDDVGDASIRDRVSMVVYRGGDGADRVLIRDHATGETREAIAPAGRVDEAIEGFCDWVESLNR